MEAEHEKDVMIKMEKMNFKEGERQADQALKRHVEKKV